MLGAIQKWDVLTHPWITVGCFGWAVFFRSLFAPRTATFLSLLADVGILPQQADQLPESLERCIELEQRAGEIYRYFAERFGDQADVRTFFEALAEQEQKHADLLAICRAEARRGRWLHDMTVVWLPLLPAGESNVEEAERQVAKIGTLHDAMEMTLALETSEVNGIFRGVVAASSSRFVRGLPPFRTAIRDHLLYIADGIRRLDPSLQGRCKELTSRARAYP